MSVGRHSNSRLRGEATLKQVLHILSATQLSLFCFGEAIFYRPLKISVQFKVPFLDLGGPH